MSDVVIRAEGLGKKYVIGHESADRERYTALRDVIGRSMKVLGRSALDMMRGRQIVAGDETEEFWALKDVNFEIKRGEVVGIIGRNGAGKSTLLKVLSRITEPSTGRVEIKGRVSSLLEVGTGFHPELTGRENIYLNGAILGMSRAEIKKKFDEIIDFSGVEKFIDTPVKRYSSGMYVRLAFAVAAHLEPEILVVDEVLAVGDSEFQKKCLGKMKDVAGNGRTVLFVSHQIDIIQRLCSNLILMNRGTIVNNGKVDAIMKLYNKYQYPIAKNTITKMGKISTIVGVESAEFTDEKCLFLNLKLTLDCHIQLSDACIIIYTMTEQRVALIDLRISDKLLEFQNNIPKSFRVFTEQLHIVAGLYRLTLWLRCAEGAVEIELGNVSAPISKDISRLSLYPETLNGVLEVFGAIELC